MSETTPVLQSIARMPTGQARITEHYAKCSVYPIMLCKKTRLSVSSSSLKPTQECMFQTQCGILNWCPGRTENPARLGLRGMGWWLLYQDILAIKQIKAIFRLIESSWVVTYVIIETGCSFGLRLLIMWGHQVLIEILPLQTMKSSHQVMGINYAATQH